jgi:drug/metabolite transporter (DMT)-like permease
VIYAAATLTGLVLAIPGLFAGAAWRSGGPGAQTETLLAILVLGLAPTLIGHTCTQLAARRLPPAVAGLTSPGETLGSLIIGVVALGARPSTAELFGGALILLGALTVTWAAASVSGYGEDLHQSW